MLFSGARDDAVAITGASGLVGRHLSEYLRELGYSNVLTPSRSECNLTDRVDVTSWFEMYPPAYVFHLAGRVRGLAGNMQAQADAFLENTLINTHVIDAARSSGVRKIVAMGTVAMYPDRAIRCSEDNLWQGKPHGSELGYAQAKRGMLAQLEAYHSNYGLRYAVALSTNLYGPHDRFDAVNGHVIPSLIAKFHRAGQLGTIAPVWGDGSAQRDFLHVKDCVRALVLLMEQIEGVINLASGTTSKIKDVVDLLVRYTKVSAAYDASKPIGQLVRSYDVSRLTAAGFTPQYSLEQGIKETYDWYAANAATARG